MLLYSATVGLHSYHVHGPPCRANATVLGKLRMNWPELSRTFCANMGHLGMLFKDHNGGPKTTQTQGSDILVPKPIMRGDARKHGL